jgi:hypothetical protein
MTIKFHNLNSQVHPGRGRAIERALLRMGLDPADLSVFDD